MKKPISFINRPILTVYDEFMEWQDRLISDLILLASRDLQPNEPVTVNRIALWYKYREAVERKLLSEIKTNE